MKITRYCIIKNSAKLVFENLPFYNLRSLWNIFKKVEFTYIWTVLKTFGDMPKKKFLLLVLFVSVRSIKTSKNIFIIYVSIKCVLKI